MVDPGAAVVPQFLRFAGAPVDAGDRPLEGITAVAVVDDLQFPVPIDIPAEDEVGVVAHGVVGPAEGSVPVEDDEFSVEGDVDLVEAVPVGVVVRHLVPVEIPVLDPVVPLLFSLRVIAADLTSDPADHGLLFAIEEVADHRDLVVVVGAGKGDLPPGLAGPGIQTPEFAVEIEDEFEGAIGIEIHDRQSALAPEGISDGWALPGLCSILPVADKAAFAVPGGGEEEFDPAVPIHVACIGEPAVELGAVLEPGKFDPGDGSEVAGGLDLCKIHLVDRPVLVLFRREGRLGGGRRGHCGSKQEECAQSHLPHADHGRVRGRQ